MGAGCSRSGPHREPHRWMWLWKLLADAGRTLLSAVRYLFWLLKHGEGPGGWFS